MPQEDIPKGDDRGVADRFADDVMSLAQAYARRYPDDKVVQFVISTHHEETNTTTSIGRSRINHGQQREILYDFLHSEFPDEPEQEYEKGYTVKDLGDVRWEN